MGWQCGTYGGEKKNAYRVLVGKPEGRRPLVRYRYWMDIKGIGWEGVEWIKPAQGRDKWWALMYTVMKFGIPGN